MRSKRDVLLAMGSGLLSTAFAQAPSIAPSTAPSTALSLPKPKGPLVWLDLDQTELDAAYDQSKYAPNTAQVIQRYASNSELTRSRIGQPQIFQYGPTPYETLDLYPCKRENAPIHIFIHGGAWRGGKAKDYGFISENMVNAGAHCIIPDFINVIESNGDLMPMAQQVQQAVVWVYKNAARLGGDQRKIYISGHSSGAHLAGVALTSNWMKDFNVPMNIFKGGVLCSGMYDLKPVRLSARSSYVKFTDATEDALSSQRHLEFLNTPLIVFHGSLETPEFQRQNKDFAKAVQDMGKPVKFVIGQNYNHFELLETFANPYGVVGQLILEQMKIG